MSAIAPPVLVRRALLWVAGTAACEVSSELDILSSNSLCPIPAINGSTKAWCGLEELPGVFVARIPQNIAHRAALTYLPLSEHQHVVGNSGGHAEVVRNEQQCEAHAVPQVKQQVKDDGLDRDVEREVTSSQTSKSGRAASARARATR